MSYNSIKKLSCTETKAEAYSKNNSSLINPKVLINEAEGLLFVCGHGNSRTVYIESHTDSNERLIAKYSIEVSDASFASDETNRWVYAVLSNSTETANEIQSLRQRSHITEEYQVDKASIQRFTSLMDTERNHEYVLNGEQNDGIIAALAAIGKTIEFPRNNRCSIS